ncbi:MAG: hypothetical protein LBB60_04355 [Desulfovibrio sp.]|jgi:hypothetical protein|nr:hypothetical protein [Desulfovibrio sp.]
MLFYEGVQYKYELEKKFPGGLTCKPDFTITKPNGDVVYWEHLGLLSDPGYENKWKWKKKFYENNDISEAIGNLITSEDDRKGGLDTRVIKEKIAALKGK